MKEGLKLVYANWLSQVDRPRFRRLVSKGRKWDLFEIDPAAPPSPNVLSPGEIEYRCGLVVKAWPRGLSTDRPNIMAFLDSTDRERTRQAALVLGVALELYHREHGRFPDALDELVKERLSEVDPGRSFWKRGAVPLSSRQRTASGAILWSVWTDGIDQDGKARSGSPARSDRPGDKIFRIAAPR